jgi:hypothetical protein
VNERIKVDENKSSHWRSTRESTEDWEMYVWTKLKNVGVQSLRGESKRGREVKRKEENWIEISPRFAFPQIDGSTTEAAPCYTGGFLLFFPPSSSFFHFFIFFLSAIARLALRNICFNSSWLYPSRLRWRELWWGNCEEIWSGFIHSTALIIILGF